MKLTGSSRQLSGRRMSVVWVLSLLVAFGAGGTLAAAATEVTFWHALGSDHQAVLNELVAEFNAANPDVVVRAEYQGSYGDLQTKLIAAVSAGRAPTVSLVYNNWTAAFLDAGALVPVEQFFDHGEHGLSQAERDDYVASFVAANTWDGRWVTMPFNKSIYVLYYNQELLDRAGVGVPATMDELRAAAKAVKDKTGVYGFALKADIDHFGVFLHAFGGRWIEDGKTAFNGPEGVAALRFMQDLVLTDGSAYYHDGYLDEEFNVGNTAMFMATVATIPWVSNDLNWGAAPIPAGAVQASLVQGTDLAIFAQATPEEQLAAWRFVKFLTSPEVNARWAVATGYLPVRESAAQSATYQEYVNQDPKKYGAGVAQLEHAKFDPGLAAWFDARRNVTEAVEEALILGVDPQDALNRAAQATDRALGL